MTDAGMTSGRTKYVALAVLAVLWLAGLLAFARGMLPAPLLLAMGTAATLTISAGLDRAGRITADAIAAAGLGLAVAADDSRLALWSAILTFLAIVGAAEYIAVRAAGNTRQVRHLQERARLLEDIVDTDPNLIFVKNRQNRLTFVNEAVRRFVGLSDAQILGHTDEVFGCSPEEVSMYQESDRAALAANQPVYYPAGVLTDSHGAAHWFESIKVALPSGNNDANILVIGTEVSDRIESEQLTQATGELLLALAEATALLLAAPEFDSGMQGALQRIGAALPIDRIQVIEHRAAAVDGQARTTQRCVWTASTASASPTAEPEEFFAAPGFSRLVAQLRQGVEVTGRDADFDEAIQDLLRAQGVRAIYALPIQATGEFWGFVSFENCRSDEHIPDTLHPALGTLANSLGAAITRHDARLAVQLQEEATRAMLDGLPSQVVVMEPGGRIRFANQALADFLNMPVEELIGKLCNRVLPQPVFSALAQGEIGNASTDSAYTRHGLHPVRDLAGQIHWFQIVTRPLPDQTTGEILTLSVNTDVSALKEADEALGAERTMLQVLIDNLPDLIFIKDRQSRYVTANAAHLALLGANRVDDIIGKRDHDFFSAASSEPFFREEQAIMESNQAVLERVEEINVDTPDRRRWVLASKIPLADAQGTVTGLIVISRDITSLKQGEEALRSAKETAEAATAAKSVFLATMSHEIRTPMNAVIAMTDLLTSTKLTPEQADYVNTIRVGGESLLSVINDILDFSKIEAGKLELEEYAFNLVESLEETMHLLAPRASQKLLNMRLQLGDNVPVWVVGDAGRLRQIVMNLLNNAVKFTDSGEVNIAVTATGNGAQRRLHFAIQDTGIGIPAERMNRLFQSFSQVDSSTTRRFGGTGLGLAICKRLVELMGGTISVESIPGVGSTFTFDVVMAVAAPPVMMGREMSHAGVAANSAAVSPLRILLAEDNTINQKVALRVLDRLGYGATVVDDGQKAVTAALEQPYDIILMDLHMPELNGLDATRLIRASTTGDTRPYIIALTADAADGYEQRCLEAGMDAIVIKPIRIDDLSNALAHARDALCLAHQLD